MLPVLLTHLPPRGPLTFFPAPEGQAVKRLLGGASRVRVTSSDDSRVDRIACAGSPSSSRLFFEDGAVA